MRNTGGNLIKLIWVVAAGSLVLAAPASATDVSLLTPRQASILADVDSLHQARALDAVDSLLAIELAATRAGGGYQLELIVRQGRFLVSFGQSARATPVLAEAIVLAEAQGDSLNLARAIRWLSLAEGLQGRQEQACVLYRRLRDVAVACGDSLHEGWSLVGLGWDSLNRGLLTESHDYYERAVSLFVGLGDQDAEIWARNGYALVLQRQGDYQAALALYRELMATAQRTGYTVVEAMACNNTGSLLQKLGDPGSAVPHYQRARELQLAAHQPREAVIPALNIAVCHIDQGQLDDAVKLLRELDQLCLEEGFPDQRADVLYELARVRGQQNRLVEAAELHRRIDGIPEQLPVGTHVRHITGLARILAEMDSTETALAVITRGRADFLEKTAGNERLMLDLGYGERLADAGRMTEALEVLAGVAAEAAASGLSGYRISARTRGGEIHLEEDRPDSALVWFRLAAAAWEAERGVPLDPRWREQRGAYGQLIYPQLARILLEEENDPAPAYDAVHVFKARTLSETMLGPGIVLESHPDSTANGTGGLQALQDFALRPGELFLDYYLGPEQSFLFAATPAIRRAVQLPGLTELEGLLGNYHTMLAAQHPVAGGEQEAGRRVAEVLFKGVADLVAASTHILWAPDGPLHRIPLATLPEPDARRAGTLLTATHTITRIPSAAALLNQRRIQRVPSRLDTSAILAVAGSHGSGGVELAGPAHEVEDLRRSYESVRVLIDPDPADLWSAEGAEGESILHLAAHAVVDPQHPWRSAFVLGEDPQTQWLSAGAVARQRLSYRMAVLSSCESVGSRALVGEGQLGLSSAFLGAGVPAVVATLWPVSDRVAREFTRAFYISLSEGLTVARALQKTQVMLRGSDLTAHPGAWASFVLVGDGDARFLLEKRQERFRFWWLTAVVMIAVCVGWWIRRRRS